MAVSSPLRRLPLLVVAAVAFAVAAACSEPAPPPAPAPPPVQSAEARAAWYQDCWNQFNSQAWEKFQACYADDAVSESMDGNPASVTGRANIIEAAKTAAAAFPDRKGEVRLMLVNGDKLASVALYTATNTGPMSGPDGKPSPATGKAVGFLMAHTVALDPTGSFAVRDADYIDEGTLMAQLGVSQAPARPVEKATGGPATVVLARNDATEQANLSAMAALLDAFNKHDVKGIDAVMAEDYHGTAVAEPKDANKKESLAGTKDMFSAFPDVKLVPASTWAAGDYVVMTGTFEGTNTGDMVAMQMKKTGKPVSVHFIEIVKLENGKVKDDWVFYNGAAMMAQLGVK